MDYTDFTYTSVIYYSQVKFYACNCIKKMHTLLGVDSYNISPQLEFLRSNCVTLSIFKLD